MLQIFTKLAAAGFITLITTTSAMAHGCVREPEPTRTHLPLIEWCEAAIRGAIKSPSTYRRRYVEADFMSGVTVLGEACNPMAVPLAHEVSCEFERSEFGSIQPTSLRGLGDDDKIWRIISRRHIQRWIDNAEILTRPAKRFGKSMFDGFEDTEVTISPDGFVGLTIDWNGAPCTLRADIMKKVADLSSCAEGLTEQPVHIGYTQDLMWITVKDDSNHISTLVADDFDAAIRQAEEDERRIVD